MNSADPPASAAHTRAIRSFAQREDAERARLALADSNIASTIREFRVPDNVTGKIVSRGCSLCIDPADAAGAARLLLRMAPSEAPASVGAKSEGPTRLRRRVGKPERQRSSLLIIVFAVVCAAGMILFAAYAVLKPKKPALPQETNNIEIEEDLNRDSVPDVKREFTWNWIPLLHSEDRNFDSKWDIQWGWKDGKPAWRKVDLNFDGSFDEHTTYGSNGQLFFTDIRHGGKGPPSERRIFREGLLWKTLTDRDANGHFDHVTELSFFRDVVRDEDLPKDSPEDAAIPPWPEPWPEPEEDEDTSVRKNP